MTVGHYHLPYPKVNSKYAQNLECLTWKDKIPRGKHHGKFLDISLGNDSFSDSMYMCSKSLQ